MSDNGILCESSLPRVTVITVTRNDAAGLTRTVNSVLEQDHGNFQFVVVDGASTDDSLAFLNSRISRIDVMLTEPDIGIYHAMNKAINLADGEWLLFMNAGDVFLNKSSLSLAASKIQDDTDVIYSDWIYQDSRLRVKADIGRMNVRHQSVLYKKSLHVTYGNYVVGRKVSISDYIFFLSISREKWVYCSTPISICDQDGVSAHPSHFYQRIATEVIFGRRSNINGAFIIFFYPVYRFLKRRILWLRNASYSLLKPEQKE